MQKKILQFIFLVAATMTISDAWAQIGRVGINTTSPLAMLHVKDSSVVFTSAYDLLPNPANPPVSDAGTRMMWYGEKAAFRAGKIIDASWNKDSIGNYSFAAGFTTRAKGAGSVALGSNTKAYGLSSIAVGGSTKAVGNYSFATGFSTSALGLNSTAMGEGNQAIGGASLASGSFTKATGNFSSAFGISTNARPYGAFVIGQFNDTSSISGVSWNPSDPLFIVGNGLANNTRKNALTVLKNSRTGINTSAPAAMLHVKDSSVVFTGPASLPGSPGQPAVSGPGTRMMWYPNKSAFRSGTVSGAQWDQDSIGSYSVAFGSNTIAKGFYSMASGSDATASGNYAVAMGHLTIASGSYAFAMGEHSKAIGGYSTATGFNNSASGSYSTAMGLGNKAMGSTSLALGNITTTIGTATLATGFQVKARAYASVALGRYNDTTAISGISWDPTDPVFIIGNGTANNARSNAFTVLKNGKVGIGIHNPGFLLNFPNGFGDKISLWGSSGNHYGIGVQSGLLQIHTDAAVADIVFGYGTSAAFTETMRIEGTGNVGIGTTTPDYKLDVEGRARIASGGNAGTSAGIYYNKVDNSATAGFIGMYTDDYIGFFGDLGAGWDFVMHTATGNVGIGSLAPSQRLHVEGNGLFTGTVTASCGVLVCSDERYKTHIRPLTNSLASILLLQGIQYDWKSEQFPEKNFPHSSQIGFSAQELEKIYPEMVHTDNDGYKTVDYTRLTPVLVEAMKEQQSQIDTLKSELNQLREIVTAMKISNQ